MSVTNSSQNSPGVISATKVKKIIDLYRKITIVEISSRDKHNEITTSIILHNIITMRKVSARWFRDC